MPILIVDLDSKLLYFLGKIKVGTLTYTNIISVGEYSISNGVW